MIIFVILVTFSCDLAVILSGEVRYWLLLGVKRFKENVFSFSSLRSSPWEQIRAQPKRTQQAEL